MAIIVPFFDGGWQWFMLGIVATLGCTLAAVGIIMLFTKK